MEDEDDYMAMSFAEETPAPGRGSAKRRCGGPPPSQAPPVQAISKRQRQQQMLKAMKTSREEGMLSSLGPDNKGYSILAKMGYTSGTGLGAEGQGVVEPVGVTSRDPASHHGLGMDALIKDKTEKAMERRKEHIANKEILAKAFIETLHSKYSVSKLISEIHKMRRVLSDLDERASVSPHELWTKDAEALYYLCHPRNRGDVGTSASAGATSIATEGSLGRDGASGGAIESPDRTPPCLNGSETTRPIDLILEDSPDPAALAALHLRCNEVRGDREV